MNAVTRTVIAPWVTMIGLAVSLALILSSCGSGGAVYTEEKYLPKADVSIETANDVTRQIDFGYIFMACVEGEAFVIYDGFKAGGIAPHSTYVCPMESE